MNMMTKLLTGIGSVTASIHNGVDTISTSSIKDSVGSLKATTVKYGSAIAQGYASTRKPKQGKLPLAQKS